jgi:hypothetical protein
MLALRPSCEQCNKALPPESTEAMICSYECTFCTECIETLLINVCPNCGGGFAERPVRPKKAYRPGVSITHQPASTTVVHKPVDVAEHAAFAEAIKRTAPHER